GTTAMPKIAPLPEVAKSEGISPLANVSIPDDRFGILPSDKAVLIVEDDRELAQWLLDAAHEAGFKAIVTPQGRTAAALVYEYGPIAITLDLQLRDIEGSNLLERFKPDLKIRHVPVIALSAPSPIPQN